jgi:hypothetical protein
MAVLDAAEVGRAGLAGQAALLDRFLLTLNVLASFFARTRLRTQHSFPIIRPIVSNPTSPVRRARSVWVVSSVISIRRAFRSVSNRPTARLSSSLSSTSNTCLPARGEGYGRRRRRGPSGNNLAVVAPRNLSELAKILSFHAKKERPGLLRHMSGFLFQSAEGDS